MKKLTITILTILTLILTACGSASSSTPQTDPSAQAQTLPAATRLIVGTFKLEGTDQAVTAGQAKALLPLWQVYQDLLTSDTAAQEEIDALVEQAQETMTPEQTQAISALNLTQRDVFTLMQEKGLGMTQRSSSSGGNSTGNRTNFEGGGFAPPEGGFPAGGFPGGGPDGGGGFPGGNQTRNSSQSGTDTTTRPTQINPGTLLLDPLIKLLKQKAGS